MPANKSGKDGEENTPAWPSAPPEVGKRFSALLQEARKSEELKRGGDTERLYEQVVAYAQEWGIDSEICNTLRELGRVYLDSRKFSKALTVLQSLLRRQERELGKNHSTLAGTEMLIGVCQQQRRDVQSAMKSLRSAVIRFQQSDKVDRDLFVECLCALSSIYRDNGKLAASRTCIKQAYRLLPGDDAPLHLQIPVLEELAAVILSEHRYRSARTAYRRLIALKAELLTSKATDMVRPLIKLGLCNFSMHDFDAAEEALFKAGELYYELGYRDRPLLIQNLETLAGVLRHQGQFVLASLIEESAVELYGLDETVSPAKCGRLLQEGNCADLGIVAGYLKQQGQFVQAALVEDSARELDSFSQIGSHAMYGHLLQQAYQAELDGNVEEAKTKYREALSMLELQSERRMVDRLPILSRLFLCTTSKHSLQRASLWAEIEDAIRTAFAGSLVETEPGLRKLSLIYRLCGKDKAAADLSRLADEANRKPRAVGKTKYLILSQDSA